MTNREQVLALMEEYIRTRRLKLNSERLILELLTFVVNDQGKAEADEGCHDDLVMSLGLAGHGLKDLLATTPMESTLGENHPIPAEAFSRAYKHSMPTFGDMEEEDLKWLIGK